MVDCVRRKAVFLNCTSFFNRSKEWFPPHTLLCTDFESMLIKSTRCAGRLIPIVPVTLVNLKSCFHVESSCGWNRRRMS